MSVVGIDLGTYSSYIGVARAGGIETLANEYSDRITPSYVSLGEKNRAVGSSAKQQAVSNFKNTIIGFKRAIGRKFEDPIVQNELQRNFKPNAVSKDSDGNVVFQMSYLGEIQDFSPSQLVGMLLNKLKFTAETALKSKVVDIVLSVPSFYTDIERRALLDACQLAGLNCLRILNDTTAVALAYGIYKTDLPEEKEKPRNVVFVDLGYSSLQASACSFHKGKLKVLATSFDPALGGRNFDELLVNHMIEEFKKKYKVDANQKPKAYIRLTQECEKLKKLMSANVNPLPLNIECFIDDKDVKSTMKRDTFEEMSVPLLQRIEDTLQAVLDGAKLKPADIHSVEIVGGSSRIPSFKTLITKVFSKEPSTTLNADEAVARGCALQCAILSPTFRVRDFSVTDCQPYPITLNWQPQSGIETIEDSTLEVFSRFHPAPFSKMLTFYRKDPFNLSAVYSSVKDIPFPSTNIGSFKVNNIVAQANGESSKVKVKVRVDSHGLFRIMSASMYEKLEDEPVEEGKEMDVDGEKKEGSDEKVNGEPTANDMEQTNGSADGNKMEESSSAENQAKDGEKAEGDTQEGDKKTKEAAKEAAKKTKKLVKTIDLPVDSVVHQLSKNDLNNLVEKENQMVMQDKMEKERADAKNAVEEYVYEMREKMYSTYEHFVTEDDRGAFSIKLEDTENWLYEDGEDEKRQVYIDKYAELKKVGQPITDRHREAEEWPAARDEMGTSVTQIRKFLDLWTSGDEKYVHIEKADIEKVEKLLEEKSKWFDSRMTQMAQIKPHENPVVLASQVRTEKAILESTCVPIINKPKPKVEPPKDEVKPEAPEADQSNNKDTETTAPPPAADTPQVEQEMDID